jgi:hypothetical protein
MTSPGGQSNLRAELGELRGKVSALEGELENAKKVIRAEAGSDARKMLGWFFLALVAVLGLITAWGFWGTSQQLFEKATLGNADQRVESLLQHIRDSYTVLLPDIQRAACCRIGTGSTYVQGLNWIPIDSTTVLAKIDTSPARLPTKPYYFCEVKAERGFAVTGYHSITEADTTSFTVVVHSETRRIDPKYAHDRWSVHWIAVVPQGHVLDW